MIPNKENPICSVIWYTHSVVDIFTYTVSQLQFQFNSIGMLYELTTLDLYLTCARVIIFFRPADKSSWVFYFVYRMSTCILDFPFLQSLWYKKKIKKSFQEMIFSFLDEIKHLFTNFNQMSESHIICYRHVYIKGVTVERENYTRGPE